MILLFFKKGEGGGRGKQLVEMTRPTLGCSIFKIGQNAINDG